LLYFFDITEFYGYQEKLTENREFLISTLECSFGLLNILVTKNVLSNKKVADIAELHGNGNLQNQKFLECINQLKHREQRDKLRMTLRETFQAHMANCLSAEGGKFFCHLIKLNILYKFTSYTSICYYITSILKYTNNLRSD